MKLEQGSRLNFEDQGHPSLREKMRLSRGQHLVMVTSKFNLVGHGSEQVVAFLKMWALAHC